MKDQAFTATAKEKPGQKVQVEDDTVRNRLPYVYYKLQDISCEA